MDPTAFLFFGVGVALGLITSIPIGVANVAVVDAGLRVSRRRGIAIGAGGAIADTLHSGAAFTGIGPFLDRHPLVPAVLFTVSGVVIVVYGVHVVRSAAATTAPAPRGSGNGVLTGLLLTLLNPAALLAWIVIAGALAPGPIVAGVATAVGVGLGAFTWFTVLAHLAGRGRNLLVARGVSLTRWVGAALVVLGVLGVARGVIRLLG